MGLQTFPFADSRATVDSAAKSFFYLNIFLNFIWPRQPPKRNILYQFIQKLMFSFYFWTKFPLKNRQPAKALKFNRQPSKLPPHWDPQIDEGISLTLLIFLMVIFTCCKRLWPMQYLKTVPNKLQFWHTSWRQLQMLINTTRLKENFLIVVTKLLWFERFKSLY